MIYGYHVVVCVVDLHVHYTLEWRWLGRNGYIHQTCTNFSSWYYLLILCVGLCPWPTFYAWVTMVLVGRNGQVYITVPMGATFTKLAPTVHFDMIYWCHMVVCFLDLHFMLQWPWLESNGLVYITVHVPVGATFTKLAPTVHLDMIYWCHIVVCVLDLHLTLEWPWSGRNG